MQNRFSVPRTRAGDLRSPGKICSICFNTFGTVDDSNPCEGLSWRVLLRISRARITSQTMCDPLSIQRFEGVLRYYRLPYKLRKNFERNDFEFEEPSRITYLYFPFSLSTLKERSVRCEGIEIHVQRPHRLKMQKGRYTRDRTKTSPTG